MPVNLLSLDFIGVVVLFALASLLSANQPSPEKAITIGLFVAVNHSIAVAFALLPKQMWSFADIRCAGERPFLSYVISGMSALTIALPVSFGFYLLRMHFISNGEPIMPFARQCTWLLMPTVMAVALAFLCDNFAGTDREPVWLRWAECIGLAGLMALMGLLVIHWLHDAQPALHSDGKVLQHWIPVLLSASIGALFGATIPKWYRRTMRQVEATRLPALPSTHDASTLVVGI